MASNPNILSLPDVFLPKRFPCVVARMTAAVSSPQPEPVPITASPMPMSPPAQMEARIRRGLQTHPANVHQHLAHNLLKMPDPKVGVTWRMAKRQRRLGVPSRNDCGFVMPGFAAIFDAGAVERKHFGGQDTMPTPSVRLSSISIVPESFFTPVQPKPRFS